MKLEDLSTTDAGGHLPPQPAMDFKIFLKCVKPVGEWLRKREEKKKTGAAREREERIYEVRSQLPPSEFQQKTLYIKIGINMWQGTVWPGSL